MTGESIFVGVSIGLAFIIGVLAGGGALYALFSLVFGRSEGYPAMAETAKRTLFRRGRLDLSKMPADAADQGNGGERQALHTGGQTAATEQDNVGVVELGAADFPDLNKMREASFEKQRRALEMDARIEREILGIDPTLKMR